MFCACILHRRQRLIKLSLQILSLLHEKRLLNICEKLQFLRLDLRRIHYLLILKIVYFNEVLLPLLLLLRRLFRDGLDFKFSGRLGFVGFFRSGGALLRLLAFHGIDGIRGLHHPSVQTVV